MRTIYNFRERVEDFKLENPQRFIEPYIAVLKEMHKNFTDKMDTYPSIINNATNLTIPHYTNFDFSKNTSHSYIDSRFLDKTNNKSLTTTYGYMYEILYRQMNLVIHFLEDYNQLAIKVFNVTERERLSDILNTVDNNFESSFFLSGFFNFMLGLCETVIYFIYTHLLTYVIIIILSF